MEECAPLLRVGARGGTRDLRRCADQPPTSGSPSWPGVLGLGQSGHRDRALLVGSALAPSWRGALATALSGWTGHGRLLGGPRSVCVGLLLFSPDLRPSPLWSDRRGLRSRDLVRGHGCRDHLGCPGGTDLREPEPLLCERPVRSLERGGVGVVPIARPATTFGVGFQRRR